MIKFTCKCGKKIAVPEEHAGKKCKCPKCSAINIIPSQFSNTPDHEKEISVEEKDCFPKPLITLIVFALIFGASIFSYIIIHSIISYQERKHAQFITAVEERKEGFVREYGYDYNKIKELISKETNEEEIKILSTISMEVKAQREKIEKEIEDKKKQQQLKAKRAEQKRRKAIERNNSFVKLEEYGVDKEASQHASKKIKIWCNHYYPNRNGKIQVMEITGSSHDSLLVRGKYTYKVSSLTTPTFAERRFVTEMATMRDKFGRLDQHTYDYEMRKKGYSKDIVLGYSKSFSYYEIKDFSCVVVVIEQEKRGKWPPSLVLKFNKTNAETPSVSPDLQNQTIANRIIRHIVESIKDNNFMIFSNHKGEVDIYLLGNKKEYLKEYKIRDFEILKYHHRKNGLDVEVLIVAHQKDKTGIWIFDFAERYNTNTIYLNKIYNDEGFELN